MPCSTCEFAFARFHEKRRERLIDFIEKRVARHVKSGGNDTPYYRSECAYDGMRDLPQHTDRDIWNAAWKACQENSGILPPISGEEIEADNMFRNTVDPARKFRVHIEDREIHNDA